MNEANSDLLAKIEQLEAASAETNPSVNEFNLRELLQAVRDVTGVPQGRIIEILALLARSEAQQGKFSEAHRSLEEAENLLKLESAIGSAAKSDNQTDLSKIRWLIEKGRVHIFERTPSQARLLFSEAWALATKQSEDRFVVELSQLMATIEPQKSQQEWIMRGIEIAEKSRCPKTKSRLGALYMTLGSKFFELRLYEKATGYFEKALEQFRSLGKKREAFIAQWSIGKVLRVLGKTEAALSLQQQLLSDSEISGLCDGRLYEELAECLQSINRTEEAQSYFELAYKEFSSDEWVSDNQPVRLKRMKDLGKVK